MLRKLTRAYRYLNQVTLEPISLVRTQRFAKLVSGAAAVGMGPAVLVMMVCLVACVGRTATPQVVGPNSTEVHRLETDIDRKTTAIARALSSSGSRAMQDSLSRFYQWVDAYCGKAEAPKDPSGGNQRCIYDEYFNYLDHVPKSVYSVGPWTVYETAVYGLLWGATDPPDQDLHRPPGELKLSVPHVDAAPTPLSKQLSWALTEQVHSLVSGWAVEGRQLSLSVHVETINKCYATFGIEQSVYTGGAHPNGYFQSFNWNRTSDAPVNLADLFKPGTDWNHNLVTLYEKHVRSGDGGIRPSIFEDQPFLTEESLERSIDKETVVTDHGLKIVVGGLAPAYGLILPGIVLKWAELQPWLAPSAPCTQVDTASAQPNSSIVADPLFANVSDAGSHRGRNQIR